MDEVIHSEKNTSLKALLGENFAWGVIDALGQGVTVLDADGRFTYANPAYAQMVGRTPEGLIGLTPFDVNHPDDHDQLQQIKQQRWAGTQSTYEARLVKPDGTVVYANITGVPRWQNNEVIGSYAIVTDITEQKLAEMRLRQSEHRFQVLTELTSDIAASVRLEENGRLIPEWLNGSFTQITGYAPEEIETIGGLSALWHPDDLADRQQMITKILQGESFVDEYRIITKDGRIRWLRNHIQPELDPDTGQLRRFYTALQDITERKETALAVEIQGQFIHKILAANPNVLYIFDLDQQKPVFLNEQAAAILNFTPTDIADMRSGFLPEMVHPEDLPTLMAHFARLQTAADDDILEFEYRMRHPDGTYHWFNSRDTVFKRDENGRVQQILGSATDITDHKQALNALQKSQSQLAGILDSAMDAVVIIDEAQTIVMFNAAAEQLFGYAAAEIIGQPHSLLLPQRFRAGHEHLVRQFAQSGVTIRSMNHLGSLRALRANGQEFPVEVSISQAKTDGETVYTAILRDITARQEAQAALTASEERYRALTEHSQDGVLIYDLNGYIVYVSPTTTRMMGYATTEILAADPVQFTHPDDLPGLLVTLNELLQTPGRTITTQYRMRHKDGSWRWLESNISNFTHEAAINGLIFNFRDITDRQTADEALRQSEERYRTTLENMLEGCQIIGFDWTYHYVNNAAASQGRQPKEALLGHTMMAVYPGIETTDLFAVLQRCMNERTTAQMENEFVYADGRRGWFELSIQPVPEGLFILSFDITERNRVEAALQQTQENLRMAYEAAEIGIWRNDLVAGILHLDERARTHYGFTRSEITLPELFSRVHPEDVEYLQTVIHAAISSDSGEKVAAEYRVIHPDGSVHWLVVRVRVEFAGEGAQRHAIVGHGTTQDITERKQSETAIRELQNILAEAESVAQIGSWQWDLQTQKVTWSDEMFVLFGMNPKGFDGDLTQIINTRIHPDDLEAVNRANLAVLEGHNPVPLEYRIVLPDGTERIVWAEGRLTYDPSGQPATVIGYVQDITDRKRIEKALLESEEKLRLFIEHAPASLAMFDREMRYLSCSYRWLSDYFLGDTPVIGRSHYEIFPEITDEWKAIHQRSLAGEVIRAEEDKFVRLDGTVQWLRWEVRPWYAADDTVGGIVVFSEDITERKDAALALAQSEARYRAIVEDQTELIMRAQGDGTLLFVNEAYRRIYGSTVEQLKERNFFSLLDDPERTTVQDKISRLTPDNPVEVNEHPKKAADGRTVWLRWTDRGIFDEDGRLLEIQGVGHDITERREAEERLRQSEAQLQHVIDAVPDGVLLLDVNSIIQLANPVAEQYLAMLAPDWVNGRLTHLSDWPINDLFTSPPDGLLHEIIEGDHIFGAIARPVEIGAYNSGWVLVIHDMTQERTMQQRAQQQERLAAVGQLAAGIAHDFNNIMAVITLYSQLVARTVDMPTRAHDRLTTIEQQANRATDLIQQILDFSRQSVLERQPLDLVPFTKELVKLLDRTLPEHIQIDLAYTGDSHIIHADPSRIQQVMMNLAVNARDAMPDGGHLHIDLTHLHLAKKKHLLVHTMPPGNWVQIEITDTGSGIPPQALPQIFEPFFTTKEVGKGTGLGLAQVYGIIQQHEGYVDVSTQLGQGTTFTLYFPAFAPHEKQIDAQEKRMLALGEGQVILLVEDNSPTRQALQDSLTLLNYVVLEARNGREALHILAQQANQIDLILSDVVMPEMGGVALLHAIRQQNLPIPVILLTGHPLNRELEDLQSLGLAGWLLKPPHLADLSDLLAQVLAT
ncbi:MAG: PAS domain S-box protein [Ardenticatenaceae bacterium]|nr:PAS domain S-box protein [Ardenticatenaceae bacterium]